MNAQKLSDINIRINKTSIQVVQGDITEISADAIVSSDDTYLSMGGGVSSAIREKAGYSLRDDVRKQPLPLQIGDVAVTTAGRLNARYVLHATTLGFSSRLPITELITKLVKKILEISKILQLESVAVPLLGGGTAGLPNNEVFKFILMSAMYFLASDDYKIKKLIIVLYRPGDISQALDEIKQK